MRLLWAVLILWFSAPLLRAREVSLTILHTCDLHGQIPPTGHAEGTNQVGGIARCATRIREIRAQTRNVLLIDAGDTLQGSAASYLSDGQVMVRALNYLRYDVWVWGNHEFDWGLDKLAACGERAEMPILNANVSAAAAPAGDAAEPAGTNAAASRILSLLKPYILREIDGVKVAVIGLNTPGIPTWSRPRLIGGLRFADSQETLKKLIPAVRKAGAQVIVLVCHQGYREWGDDHANQINAIARNFPEADVIVGAHTHQNCPEVWMGNVLYSQSGHLGAGLGRIDLVFDTDQGRVTRRLARTLSMDDQVSPDAGMLKLAGAELDRAHKYLGTVIGEATADFNGEGAPQRESPIHNLICEAIVAALRDRGVTVEAVVHGTLNDRAAITKGAVTIGDAWSMVPFENAIGVAQLLPAELREVLDEDVAAYRTSSFRGLWGLRATFNPNGEPGVRVRSLTSAAGGILPLGTRIAVAFNSYDLASGGLRWRKLQALADQPASRLVEYDIQTRDALIDHIRRCRTITPAVQGWWIAPRRAVGSRP